VPGVAPGADLGALPAPGVFLFFISPHGTRCGVEEVRTPHGHRHAEIR